MTVLSGSALDTVNQIAQDPSSVLQFLGANLPSLGPYFLQMLIFKSFVASPGPKRYFAVHADELARARQRDVAGGPTPRKSPIFFGNA